MKLGVGAWIGIIVGLAGAALGIYASIDPMAVGSVFLKIGSKNMETWLPVGVSVFFVLLFGFAFKPLISSSIRNAQLKKRLATVGVRGRAQIVAVKDTFMTVNNNPYVGIVVEIKPGVQASFNTIVSRVQVPRVGDVIEVIYDPSDPTACIPVKE